MRLLALFPPLIVIGGCGLIADLPEGRLAPEGPVDHGGYRPHYQGFGATTAGGRSGGQRVCKVNDLGDNSGSPTFGTSGTRTLRDCVQGVPSGCAAPYTAEACARYVVFEISGTIALEDSLRIAIPYLTVAGQTAPSCSEGEGEPCGSGVSGGINIRNSAVYINTHQVVLQHLRIRHGTGDSAQPALATNEPGVDGVNVSKVAFDHLSVSWGGHATTLVIGAPASELLMVDTIVSEGLSLCATSCGGGGSSWSGHAECSGTIARNMYLHNSYQSPWIGEGCKVAAYNNVAYDAQTLADDDVDYGFAFLVDGGSLPPARPEVAYIGNVNLIGPSSPSGTPDGMFAVSLRQETVDLGPALYLRDNTGPRVTAPTGDGQWAGVTAHPDLGKTYQNRATGGSSSNVRTDTEPSWFTSFAFRIAGNEGTAIRDNAIANAGSRPMDRDAVDARLVADVVDGGGTASIVSEDEVGGHPTIAVRTRPWLPPPDPDGDGACGATTGGVRRTNLECTLEADAAFGARRLEAFQLVP